ncbi:hypothetical protein [Streptomyces sp. NBC_00145]|uniref:hypothetical protein n=1 Tax=Streptomyces sp. NBC_00145 TaxID=2975666 RepID=UPI002E199DEA
MPVNSSDEALQPSGEPSALVRAVTVVYGLRDLADPVRGPAVHDDAIAVFQEEQSDLLGHGKAPFLHEEQCALGALFGDCAVFVLAGHFGRSAFAGLANVLGLQPTGLLVNALFRGDAERFGEVVPENAGGPAGLDRFELPGVGLLAQVLPQRRAQHRGLPLHVDRAVLRLCQLVPPCLCVFQHEEQFEPLEPYPGSD